MKHVQLFEEFINDDSNYQVFEGITISDLKEKIKKIFISKKDLNISLELEQRIKSISANNFANDKLFTKIKNKEDVTEELQETYDKLFSSRVMNKELRKELISIIPEDIKEIILKKINIAIKQEAISDAKDKILNKLEDIIEPTFIFLDEHPIISAVISLLLIAGSIIVAKHTHSLIIDISSIIVILINIFYLAANIMASIFRD